MSGSGGDDGDYVLIYDGANGLRMAPRAAAAAFEGQDPGHLDMSPPTSAPDVARAAPESRPRPAVVVIGAVIGLSLLGLVAGLALRLPAVQPPLRIELPTAPAPVLAGAPTTAARPHGSASRVLAAGRRARTGHPPLAVATRSVTRTIHTRHAAPAGPCDAISDRVERIVCRDPDLAAQDARLARALRAATQAGLPPRELEDGQTVWLMERDAAARRSRAEVAAAYQRRIDDLEAQAGEAPPF